MRPVAVCGMWCMCMCVSCTARARGRSAVDRSDLCDGRKYHMSACLLLQSFGRVRRECRFSLLLLLVGGCSLLQRRMHWMHGTTDLGSISHRQPPQSHIYDRHRVYIQECGPRSDDRSIDRSLHHKQRVCRTSEEATGTVHHTHAFVSLASSSSIKRRGWRRHHQEERRRPTQACRRRPVGGIVRGGSERASWWAWRWQAWRWRWG